VNRIGKVALATVVAATGVIFGAVGSASAAPAPDVPAGWGGTCYPATFNNFNSGGGWCDGNGPDWVYTGLVECSNGRKINGPTKWAGDRTGSYASCNGNGYIVKGSVSLFHVG
jgi:hypothetical protein